MPNYSSSLAKLLLSSPYLRRWIAIWVLRKIKALRIYEPATQVASLIEPWLNSLDEITPEQLKRLTLIFFLHYWEHCRYYGYNFTTIPNSYKLNGLKMPAGFSLIFLIYHALTNGLPIKDAWEYRELLGGFPPRQLDPVRYLVNYVKGQQRLKLELSVDKDYYEYGEPMPINLHLENLTDAPLILNNDQGTSIKLGAEPMEGPSQERHYNTLESSEKEQEGIFLPPGEPMTITWKAIFQERSIYIITAQVYIPHYQQVAELLIGGISYGEPHSELVGPGDILIRDFCTV